MSDTPNPSPEFERFRQLAALIVAVPKDEIKEKLKPRARKRARRRKTKKRN